MQKNMVPVSFEFFPPKLAVGKEKLRLVADQLKKSKPEYFSVTFGAGGSTLEGTMEVVRVLHQTTGVPIAPHITCVGADRKEVTDLLFLYKGLGLDRIVALRGDLPSGMGQTGEMRYACDLVDLIRAETGDHFHIDVAAYPEFHPQAKSAELDVQSLKAKLDAGANSAITQYFYNTDAYFYYLDLCEKYNIDAPIVPGVMPITNYFKLRRFSDMCGAEIPQWLEKRLIGFADDIESIKKFGEEVMFNMCERLIQGGAPALHFYTMNYAEASSALVNKLSGLFASDEKEQVTEKVA